MSSMHTSTQIHRAPSSGVVIRTTLAYKDQLITCCGPFGVRHTEQNPPRTWLNGHEVVELRPSYQCGSCGALRYAKADLRSAR